MSATTPRRDRGGRTRFALRVEDARNIGTRPTVRAHVEASFESEVRFASSRRASEDRAEVFEVADALVVVVADGAGGIAGGAVASDAVVSAVRQRCTTALVLVVGAHGALGVSSGDSEVWSVDEDHVDRLTEGQERARLGSGRARPSTFHRRATAGILVAATDGLFRHAPERALVATMLRATDLAAVADALADLPKTRSGLYPDDVALVVVRPTRRVRPS